MVGKGTNHEDAVRILRERNKDWKFIEQRDVNGGVLSLCAITVECMSSVALHILSTYR
jgi:hypothetical protein